MTKKLRATNGHKDADTQSRFEPTKVSLILSGYSFTAIALFIGSFFIGLLGPYIVIALLFFSPFTSLFALVTGAIGWKKPGRYQDLALVSIICGAASFLVSVGASVWVIVQILMK